MTKQEYIDRNNRKQLAIEKRHRVKVQAVLKAQMSEAATVIKTSGVNALRLILPKFKFHHSLYEALFALWSETAKYYYIQTRARLRQPELKAGFGFNEPWVNTLLEFIREYLLAKATVALDLVTKQRIADLIDQGEREGWGVEKYVKALQDDPITPWRARLIVRTEIKMAEHHGRQQAREDSPFETVLTWLSAHDHRTRKAHEEADGQKVEGGGRFKVARYRGKKLIGYDYMTGPGDPTAHAENLCNCRCTATTRLKRDANGKFVRKRKIFVALPGEQVQPRPTITI